MAKKRTKKKVVKRVVKRQAPVQMVRVHPVERSRLNTDKSDGIIAIMAAVLITLISILNKDYAIIAAILMMIAFAAYKLIFKR